MPLQLRCVAQCDTEGCKYEEEMFIRLDLAAGWSMVALGDVPPPPNWETYVRLGMKKLRCPECIAQRKRDRLKVVSNAEEEGQGAEGGGVLETPPKLPHG